MVAAIVWCCLTSGATTRRVRGADSRASHRVPVGRIGRGRVENVGNREVGRPGALATARGSARSARRAKLGGPGFIHLAYLGGFSRCIELNHIIHRLCGSPSIPLSFNLAAVLPRRYVYRVNFDNNSILLSSNVHRLGCGLPGYLIRFAPHTFAPQRHLLSRTLPSPSVFLLVSTHSTATPEIPSLSPEVKSRSIQSMPGVEPRSLKPDLRSRLHALYAQ